MYLWHYDLMEDNCYQPDDPQTPRVRKTDDLRRAWLIRYGQGLFRDTRGLSVSCGTVMARRYDLPDGGVLIACAREGGLEGSVTVSLPEGKWHGVLLADGTNETELPLSAVGENHTFVLPQTELAVAVLRRAE